MDPRLRGDDNELWGIEKNKAGTSAKNYLVSSIHNKGDGGQAVPSPLKLLP